MADKNIVETLFKKRDNIVIIVLVVLSLVVSRTVYQKQIEKYEKLKEAINNEEEKGKSLERIVILNEKIKKEKGRGWNTTDTNAIIEKIYNIGLESQIKIRDIAPHDKRDEKNYIALPMSLSGEATYKDLFKFLKKLETYPSLIHVRSLAVSPSGRQKSEGRELILQMNLDVEAIYMK